MRNPWSSEKYTGPWRDSDPKWTARNKRIVGGHKVANDGVFFLPMKYFRQLFRSMSVAYYDPNF
jgi:hypothetical protein